jgi:hypothetical protein
MVTREGCNNSVSVEFAKHEDGRGKRYACPTIRRLYNCPCLWPIVKLA